MKFKLYKVATDGDVTGSEIGLKGDDANLNLKLVKDELVTDKMVRCRYLGFLTVPITWLKLKPKLDTTC